MKLAFNPPLRRSLVQQVLIGTVKAYRLLLSPWLRSACRFEPTCSRYALTALETHGAATGAYLSARRLLRCHPWCAGGCDPVPLPCSISPNQAPAATPAAGDLLEKKSS